MPFGVKPVGGARNVDFNAVYRDIIAPAVRKAGMEPLRADEENTGGIIHKAMFERLILCEYAVADLTSANANVFYELGVRHAVRPHATALIFAEGLGQLPFDVNSLRGIPYQLGPDGRPANALTDTSALADRLHTCRDEASGPPTDSPIFQLVEGFPDIQHIKTDVFREQVKYAEDVKEKLAVARSRAKEDLAAALDEVDAVKHSIENLSNAEPGVLVDIMLSYRAVEAWKQMIAFIEAMPRILRDTIMVREQLGFALNRADCGEEAERVLVKLIKEHGPSSETYGILGRVYKDRWDKAVKEEKAVLAAGLLNKAIDAYLKGFEADWRDAYPGINALTLMERRDPPDPHRFELNPVVSYAVERRIAAGKPDYWDYATRLELAMLAQEEPRARAALSDALASVREPWEAKSTAKNLAVLVQMRKKRGDVTKWEADVVEELEKSGRVEKQAS
jgi:hypothetical protein